jgi:hypothetical protein
MRLRKHVHWQVVQQRCSARYCTNCISGSLNGRLAACSSASAVFSALLTFSTIKSSQELWLDSSPEVLLCNLLPLNDCSTISWLQQPARELLYSLNINLRLRHLRHVFLRQEHREMLPLTLSPRCRHGMVLLLLGLRYDRASNLRTA